MVLATDLPLSHSLDSLAKFPQGYFSQLTSRSLNSDVRRSLEYATALLISCVLRNDTGAKGGISPVCSPSSGRNESMVASHSYMLPPEVELKTINSGNLTSSLPRNISESDHLIVPFDPKSRISLSSEDLHSINRDCSIIFRHALANVQSSVFPKRTIRFFAVDFFNHCQRWIPFEYHFPGRGIGMHFAVALGGERDASGQASETIQDIARLINSNYGASRLVSASKLPNTTFHRLDSLFLQLVNDQMRSAIGKTVFSEIEMPQDLAAIELPTRYLPPEIDHLPTEVISGKDAAKLEPGELVERLGSWVAVKQYVNFPWWHRSRLRPQFVLLPSIWAGKVLRRFAKCESVQLQPIVRDSLDRFGHFGELRVYCLSLAS